MKLKKNVKKVIDKDILIRRADEQVFCEYLPATIDRETETLFRTTDTYETAFRKNLKSLIKHPRGLKPSVYSQYEEMVPDIEKLVEHRGDRFKLKDYNELRQTVRRRRTRVREEKYRPYLPGGKTLRKLVYNAIPAAARQAITMIEDAFGQDDLKVYKRTDSLAFYLPNRPGRLLSRGTVHLLMENIVDLPKGNLSLAAKYISDETPFTGFFYHYMIETYEEIRTLAANPEYSTIIEDLRRICETSKFNAELTKLIKSELTYSHLLALVKKNDAHAKLLQRYAEKKKKEKALDAILLERIPDNYADLYPMARMMKRHFIIHIGPTNSGKTHDAIVRLEQADSGMYLAPLRLLAYEQFETINQAGVHCSLKTGEEKIIDETAKITSCTVEMADFENFYDVVVIDEAQMVADEFRGGAWTAAILGICAEEIHICAAPKAENILINMVKSCGDDYDVIHHERMTKLELKRGFNQFPQSVKPGDALIVFSRKSVHAVATELKTFGISCSIIYGSLPYDVRHQQAQAFANGDTEVVVATDAIGMGMNLPIKRVVFLEDGKYDGHRWRTLNAEEIRQIGGRAGRYGIYDVGYVDSFCNFRFLQKAFERPDRQLTKAVIAIPRTLVDIDADLSDILSHWIALPVADHYQKTEADRELALCQEMEADGCVDKHFIFQFITMPFNVEDEQLHALWRKMYLAENVGKTVNVPDYLPTIASDELKDLEEGYRVCDLLYLYSDKCGYAAFVDSIKDIKAELSEKIIALFDKNALEHKKCARCGKDLPWAFPFGTCDACYEEQHGYSRNENDLEIWYGYD